jgi:hypothetical protein
MKVHVWECELGNRHRRSAARPARRKTVAEILRMAYRRHGRDPHTQRAVKCCLR